MDNISYIHGALHRMFCALCTCISIAKIIHFPVSILIDNWEDHDVAGNRFADAVFAVNGTRYTVGNGAIALYPAFGASDDYAASEGVDISTTIELPGGGSYGFDLPAERITPVVQETWAGAQELFRFIAENYPVV